ncbi:MAG: hypothetical protein F6K35_18160 [Okeania sp. SIO2H7]|nr:hypothetical protein [Okeania sp. SIO2H7]
MDALKQKIASTLENLTKSELEEVVDFVSSISLRKQSDTQVFLSNEVEECWLKDVGGVLVVAGKWQENWEGATRNLREERIRRFIDR